MSGSYYGSNSTQPSAGGSAGDPRKTASTASQEPEEPVEVSQIPALMLDLVKRDGEQTALAYHQLNQIDWRPSTGITLQFLGTKVTIKGRNLRDLYLPLLQQRVTRIREGGTLFDRNKHDDKLTIESLSLEATE